MSPPLIPVESDANLPKEADVVVIGGGIVGVSTAHTLARRGISVALVEKGRIGAEQSSRNWGWCRQQNRDERELPMATHSLDIWDRLASEIGEDLGFRRCGLIYLSNKDDEIATWAAWSDFARPRGVDTRVLSSEAATELGRATGRRWKGGVHSPTDGTADPSRAAPVIARGIRKNGGTVHQGVAARGIETAGGRVGGVVTEAGPIRTSSVVMAGGAWASSFCHQLGISFPQAAIRSSILRLAPGTNDVPDALHTSEASITRRGDGSFTVAMAGHAALDPTLQGLRYARAFLPMFWKRRSSLWAGNLQGWCSGHESLRRWRVDEVTPMERVRILDPRPSARAIAETVRRARRHPGVPRRAAGAELGRIHRQRARRRPGDLGDRVFVRLRSRRGIQRPRVRYRPGSRRARGRPREWQNARPGRGALSARAFGAAAKGERILGAPETHRSL